MNYSQNYYDPYDLWSVPFFGKWKVAAIQGSKLGYAVSGFAAVMDLLFPLTTRKLIGAEKQGYSHIDAMAILGGFYANNCHTFLSHAQASSISVGDGVGWGYPFDWYSKRAPNGVYKKNTLPFITITPYVMEALVANKLRDCKEDAMQLFHNTWGFLEALQVCYCSDTELALSYAPVDEPMIVVNANSYAAWAYAMHFKYGENNRQAVSIDKSVRLLRWVVGQQEKDGRWYYFANGAGGNFIDCFHSCMVVRNILKTKKLLGNVSESTDEAIDKGWRFIKEGFFDDGKGLCRRFVEAKTKDPLYRWDIYDQAEYLGLLLDFGYIDEARLFRDRVTSVFKTGEDWFCRIDIFGRRWGKNFLRWGIVPFWYQSARLDKLIRSNNLKIKNKR